MSCSLCLGPRRVPVSVVLPVPLDLEFARGILQVGGWGCVHSEGRGDIARRGYQCEGRHRPHVVHSNLPRRLIGEPIGIPHLEPNGVRPELAVPALSRLRCRPRGVPHAVVLPIPAHFKPVRGVFRIRRGGGVHKEGRGHISRQRRDREGGHRRLVKGRHDDVGQHRVSSVKHLTQLETILLGDRDGWNR